jgi:hypothetical protein
MAMAESRRCMLWLLARRIMQHAAHTEVILHEMNENEAITKARRFLVGRKHAPVHWDQVRAVRFTAETTRAALEKENFGDRDAEIKEFILERPQRSHWAVDFPFVVPGGVLQSPDSICVKVYDDTAECAIAWQL